jgi:hypothetical protein
VEVIRTGDHVTVDGDQGLVTVKPARRPSTTRG